MSLEDEARARLKNAQWLQNAAPFLDILDGSDGKARVVGGIVRDTLLGLDRSTTDIDIATSLLPAEVIERTERAGLSAYPTGIDHGTVTLVANGVAAEVTTLRQDIETDGRHARVVFGTDWSADARRRDFTMNALYADAEGVLYDPLGGLADCLARRVRFIGDPDRRIAEDRLRVYRFFRFSATHGEQQFEDDALAACARASATLGQLSAERVGAEMLKLLDAPHCALTLEQMVAIGVLPTDIVSQQAFTALQKLEAAGIENGVVSRLAILGSCGANVNALKQRWRLSNAISEQTEQIIAAAKLAHSGGWFELAYRFGDQRQAAIAVAAALEGWDNDRLRASLDAAMRHEPGSFPVKGSDLIARGIPAGPEIGKTLRALEQRWIKEEGAPSRDELLASVNN